MSSRISSDKTQLVMELEAARFLASIVDSSDDAIISKTLDGIIQSWNKGAERIFGYTSKQAIGNNISLIIPPDRLNDESEILSRIRAGVRVDHFETVRLRSDGQLIDISLTVSPILNEFGKVIGASKIARDITERKRTEEALRDREQELTDFFDNATVGLHWVGADGTILRANQTELDLLGYPAEEYIGQHIAKFHADEETICTILDKLERGEEIKNCEARLLCKDGSMRHVLISSNVFQKDGKFIHTRCFTRDITDRKEADDQLKAAAESFRTLADNMAQLAWSADVNGWIYWYNQRWYDYTGTTIEEMQGWGWKKVHHPDHVDRVVVRIQKSWDTGEPWEDTFPLRSKDGNYRWFLSRALPIRDDEGNIVSWFGTNTDITAQLASEEALRSSEARFRAAVEAVSSLIWTNDAQGLMVGEQAGWANFTGQAFEEYQGLGWSRVIHPEDSQPTIDAWNLAVATKSQFAFQHRVQRRDGEWRLCTVKAVPVLNADGEVREWVGVHTDVTEQSQLENKLRQHAEELAENDRRKDEFLATLAHELRNPLAPIRNSLQLMQLIGGGGEAFEKARDVMDRQMTQMVRLVDELMDASRISTGKIELVKESVALTDVLNSAIETSRSLIDELGHQLSVVLPDRPILVEVDLTRMAQVLVNLLNNAAKYTERGGHIWLAVEEQRKEIVISVRDNGIGIDAEQLPHIFGMFAQIDCSLERSQGGLGIGLALVKRLVELHGGSVEAKSEGVGKGSEVVLRLPAATKAIELAPESIEKQVENCSSSLRILVVDDNRDSVMTLSMLLKYLGNETRTAYDGEEAVAVAATFMPDVILLDIGLPKLNGYEACRIIREQPHGKNIYIVAQTGWGQKEDRERTHDAGFDYHMVKPLDTSVLKKLLAELIRNRN